MMTAWTKMTTGMKTKTKGAGMSERQCRCFYHGSDLDGHCAGAAGFELPPARHPLEVFDRIGGGIPDPAGAA